MHIFALRLMDEIRGKQKFYKLIVDGVSLLDEFEFEISTNPKYFSLFRKVLTLMELIANNQTLPGEKFKTLRSVSWHQVKEYEFKSGPLRVYAFNIEGGKIVVCGGYKNSQKTDIRKFQSLKRQYVESLARIL